MGNCEMICRVKFVTKGLDKSWLRFIPGLEKLMQDELLRCYHIYVDKTNGKIIEELNANFDKSYPKYFDKHKGQDWTELRLYNRYMADGLRKSAKIIESDLLEFDVGDDEINFYGILKADKKVSIEFFIIPVNQ